MNGLASAIAALVLQMQGPYNMAHSPASVRAVVAEAVADCRRASGPSTFRFRISSPRFITKADFNGDGTSDFVVDRSAFHCSNAPSLYCGTGGCGYSILVSKQHGFRASILLDARTLEIVRDDKWPMISITRHGTACGLAGARDCRYLLAWRMRGFRAVRAPKG